MYMYFLTFDFLLKKRVLILKLLTYTLRPQRRLVNKKNKKKMGKIVFSIREHVYSKFMISLKYMYFVLGCVSQPTKIVGVFAFWFTGKKM